MPEISIIETALKELTNLSHYLDKKLKEALSINPEELFKSIKKTIEDIDKPSVPLKPPKSDQYIKQWNEFLENPSNTEISRTAIKYLCWESDIVHNPLFYNYLSKNDELLSPRAIKGLVSSIHMRWQKESFEKEIVKYAVQQIKDYSGRDRTLIKWKSNIPMILGEKAYQLFAHDVIFASLQDIKKVAESWALFENSDYMRHAAVSTSEWCMGSNDFGEKTSASTIYVLDNILNWQGFEVDGLKFRYVASKLINHDKAMLIKEEIRTRILTHPMLGDPRLPSCRNNWNGMNPDAKIRFMGWLAERDIVFFFDNVLKGRDRQGRRSFWLNYVNSKSLIASRSFLSETATLEIKRYNTDREKINFGLLHPPSASNRAAFILHFGNIVVIEFSEVGKVFVYLKEEFEIRFKRDMWTNLPVAESTLRCQSLDSDRKIIHSRNWESKVANILSRYGVRP